jgi:hypothetical protein
MQIMMNTKRLDETFSTIFLVTEGLMIIPTIFGNLLLIMCIKRYKILQIWSNILIANLAVSDFLLGLIFIPYDMTLKHVRVMSENKFACLFDYSRHYPGNCNGTYQPFTRQFKMPERKGNCSITLQ